MTDTTDTTDTNLVLAHLENLHNEARAEIRQRIQQRDQYSNQLTIVLGVIAAIAATGKLTSTAAAGGTENSITFFTHRIILVAPLISFYFTMLILFSYKIHKVITDYLKNEIEPRISELCNTPQGLEWEHFYASKQKVGIRSSFFVVAMWVVATVAPLLVGYLEDPLTDQFKLLLMVISAFFITGAIIVTTMYRKIH